MAMLYLKYLSEKTDDARFFKQKYRVQCSIENYCFCLSLSEKPSIGFFRGTFSLQTLLRLISPEHKHFETCEATFPYVSTFFVFCVLSTP